MSLSDEQSLTAPADDANTHAHDDPGLEHVGPVFDVPHDPVAVMARSIEALLFAADRPLDIASLQMILETDLDELLWAALDRLKARFDGTLAGLVLTEVDGGFQLRTASDLADLVMRLRESKPARLSRAALETLSIIAYRQPVTRAEIAEVRGVDSSGVVRTLADLRVIRGVGRRNTPGRPMAYGTTHRFLRLFGLKSLDDLPTLDNLEGDDLPPLLQVKNAHDAPPDDDEAPPQDTPALDDHSAS